MSHFKALNVCFEGQRENEEVFIFLRRHPVSFVPFLLIVILILFIPFIVAFILGGNINRDIAIVGLTFYYLGSLSVFMIGWLDFYYDIYIVTDTRVVDIDQNGLFHRVHAELEVEQVEDVTFRLQGILGNVFNYGVVEIQTAAERRNFFLKDVPDPKNVAAKILEIAQYYRTEKLKKTN